jgi:hypothetical protein
MTLLRPTPSLPPAPAAAPGDRLLVPWSTVLPLAVVLAFVDGFCTTTLRSAVGAVERSQDPFTSYWRTSLLLVPVFVLAVLAALTLALRWFGPVLRGRRPTFAAIALVALAATLAAVGVNAASAAYDYALQSSQLAMMQPMHTGCDALCLARQKSATLTAHGLAIAYTGMALLVANLVVVGWLVALRGGRMAVAAVDRPAAGDARRSPAGDLRVLLVAALLGSAAVHAAMVPGLFEGWPVAGVVLVLLALAEVAVGRLLVGPPARWVPLAAAVVSAGPLALWLVARTAGLPFGPTAGRADSVGLADGVAVALELVTLAAAAALLGNRRRPRLRWSPHVRALVVTAVLALAAVGLAGAAPGWFDGAAAPTGHPMVMPR